MLCGELGRSIKITFGFLAKATVSNDLLPLAASGAFQLPKDVSSCSVISAKEVSPATNILFLYY